MTNCSNVIKKITDDVKNANNDINNVMVKARETSIALDNFIENLYINKDKYDLSIENMDVDKGGKYKFFNGRQYHKAVNDGGPTYIVTMDLKDYTDSKKTIRLLENVESLIKDNSSDYFGQSVLCDNYVLQLYPWADVISVAQPNLDIKKMFWFFMADPQYDPDKKTIWLNEPFAQLAYGSWVIDVLSPFYEGDTFRGVVNCSVYLTKVGRDKLSQYSSMLLLTTQNGKVISANTKAKNILKINILNEVEHLEQMRENKFIEEQFNLNYKVNHPDIVKFGEKLMNENSFVIKIYNKNYFVYKKNIEERPKLMVVGLIEK